MSVKCYISFNFTGNELILTSQLLKCVWNVTLNFRANVKVNVMFTWQLCIYFSHLSSQSFHFKFTRDTTVIFKPWHANWGSGAASDTSCHVCSTKVWLKQKFGALIFYKAAFCMWSYLTIVVQNLVYQIWNHTLILHNLDGTSGWNPSWWKKTMPVNSMVIWPGY